MGRQRLRPCEYSRFAGRGALQNAKRLAICNGAGEDAQGVDLLGFQVTTRKM